MTVLLNRDSRDHRPGHHRPHRFVPCAGRDQERHQHRRRRDAGEGRQTHLGRPVFDTVEEAVAATGADASLMFVPPAFAADSMMEAADAGLKFSVSIADGIPT